MDEESRDGQTQPDARPPAFLEPLTVAVVVVATAVLSWLVLRRVDGINGPAYWRWPWRGGPGDIVGSEYVLALPAAVTLLAAQVVASPRLSRRIPVWVPLVILTLTAAFLLHGAQEISSPGSVTDRVAGVLESDPAHGFHDDAMRLATEDDWLRRYPDLLPTLHLHPSTKGPGIILAYRALASVLGYGRSLTNTMGLLLGFVSLLAVPAVYVTTRVLGGGRRAGLLAATFMAIAPSLGAFWPSFDAVYPVVACVLIVLWHRALDRSEPVTAAVFGIALALTVLFAWNILVLGAFLLLLTIVLVRRDVSVLRVALQAGIALAAFAVFYVVTWIAIDYDVIATFTAALDVQQGLLELIPRPYPDTALFDLTDVALGLGWAPAIVAVVGTVVAVVVALRTGTFWTGTAAIRLACLLQLVIVAVLALLPGETARVMLFMFPLVIIAAAMEAARWRVWSSSVLVGATFVLSILITRTMSFVLI